MGSSDRFVYPRIAGAIRKKIEDREYPLGSKIPSERAGIQHFCFLCAEKRRCVPALRFYTDNEGAGQKGGQQDTDMENAVLCACVFPDGGTDRGQRCA